ncbi:serine hydrolase domain-containing protein [Gordonia sp. DT30]|uniref:serine hydrolase domain-containing protein n=1 Tax=unclassified Gordonia (in: high G+C Gram-positive bacteria) TaxID=2657482 RepID=UPI003CFB0679
MRSRGGRGVVLGIVLAVAAGLTIAASPVVEASPATDRTSCALPGGGQPFGSSAPGRHGLDAAKVNDAIAYASSHMRLSVQIFRDNCLVGTGPLNAATQNVPFPMWSSTKSVISLLTGIAIDQHKLGMNDPIGKYLPRGWGDAAHRSITVHELLTQTSGIKQSILSEAATSLSDPSIAQEALAYPLDHAPGTHWVYGQRQVDLLGYVVHRAVGEDLVAYAQRNLFGPVGIPASSYAWLRDQSGQPYGYAHLFLPPVQYAKLGLLLQNQGVWKGRRVISEAYVDALSTPTPSNPCYGLLFWTNAGNRCTSADFPAAVTVNHRMIESAPADLYAMVGFLHQNNFIIPSLHMVITWTGVLGDSYPNIAVLLSAVPAGDLYHNFFRILMSGVKDVHVPDPGPYRGPGESFEVDPSKLIDPEISQKGLAPNVHCNVLSCTSG